MNVNDQIAEACHKISTDPQLQNGYNSIGFSQGGQFLRAVAQRCPSPPMQNLVSIGGQHQGVFGLPHCSGDTYLICNYVRKLLTMGAYLGFIQNHIVQAEYWHDPLQEEEYRKYSVFLADINQERHINTSYKENLAKLKNLVLVKFENDTMVEPRESEWFGFYKPGQSSELFSLQESDLYKQDKLGLKTLDEQGRIHLLSVPGEHLQFSTDWFINDIVMKYL
jgi:palmitoyl-protein thioesterase